jgi:phosphomannomutase
MTPSSAASTPATTTSATSGAPTPACSPPCKLDEVEAAYARPGVATDRLDGLTVNLGDGRWFNLRPSNTEPLLRLNVEAPSHDAMTAICDEVLALVR